MDQFYSWYFVLNIYSFPFCRVVPVLCVVVFMFSFGKQKHIRKRETPAPHVIQQLIGQAPVIKFYLTYIADRLDGLLLFLLLPLATAVITNTRVGESVESALSALAAIFFWLLAPILTIFDKKYSILTCHDKRESYLIVLQQNNV